MQPELPEAAQQAVVVDDSDSESVVLAFDFTGIIFGKSIAPGGPIYRNRSPEAPVDISLAEGGGSAPPEWSPSATPDLPMSRFVVLRRMRRQYAFLSEHGTGDDNDEEIPSPRNLLPEQFTYLGFLAWESAQEVEGGGRLIDFEGAVRPPVMPAGQNTGTFVTGSIESRYEYWLLPEWEEASDIFACHSGWDRLVAIAAPPGAPPSDTAERLEFVLLGLLLLIVTVQRHRAVPAWIGRASPEEVDGYVAPGAWPRRRSELQADIEQELRLGFAEAGFRSTQRDSDYTNWVKNDLPLMATRWFTTELMSEWILELWRELITPESRIGASDRIARYARDHMSLRLADSDIALLSALDPTNPTLLERGQALHEVRAEVRHRRAQRQRQIIAALEKARVGEAILAALRLEGASPDVLHNLMLAGIGPSDLTPIVEAFPASRGGLESDGEATGPPTIQ